MEWTTTTTLLDDLRDAGNDAAWGRFVERFRMPIQAFARRCGLPESDAEDLAQDALATFMQTYQAGRYDRRRGRLSHWMFGIAYKHIQKQRRRLARREVQIGDDEMTSFWSRIPDETTANTVWDREWEDWAWRVCVDRVRREFEPATIHLFEQVVRDNRSAAEVAAEGEIAVKAVYNAKHRVLKRLRELRHDLEELID